VNIVRDFLDMLFCDRDNGDVENKGNKRYNTVYNANDHPDNCGEPRLAQGSKRRQHQANKRQDASDWVENQSGSQGFIDGISEIFKISKGMLEHGAF
jgi:hypothetical protein